MTVPAMTVPVTTVEPPGPAALLGSNPRRRRQASAVRYLAGFACAALGLRIQRSIGLSTGFLAVVGLLPLWLPALDRYRGARLLAGLVVAALLSGTYLSMFSTTHEVLPRNAMETGVLVFTAFGGVGLLLWARLHLPVPTVAMYYAGGLLLSGLRASPGSANPWKYELSLPVTIIAFALVARVNDPHRRRLALVGVVFGMVAVDLSFDCRSHLAFVLIAAALSQLFERRSRRATAGRLRGWRVLAIPAVLVIVVYLGGSSLLLSGAAGAGLQAQAKAQVANGGSLIAGGRPEWYATQALMRHHISGFGFGARPLPSDVWLAKQSLSGVGVTFNSGYVEKYMFGGRFKLHSTLADLWSNCGLVGLLLGAVCGVLLLGALAAQLDGARPAALLVFVIVEGLWNLPFGPIFTNLPDIALALGLALALRQELHPARGRQLEDSTPAPEPAEARPFDRTVPLPRDSTWQPARRKRVRHRSTGRGRVLDTIPR
ncbi:MAG: hypothetical protein QOC80_29 [Frankiaceae bacterium]|nr:hypothetical protein [Frankiaceae bacterium]